MKVTVTLVAVSAALATVQALAIQTESIPTAEGNAHNPLAVTKGTIAPHPPPSNPSINTFQPRSQPPSSLYPTDRNLRTTNAESVKALNPRAPIWEKEEVDRDMQHAVFCNAHPDQCQKCWFGLFCPDNAAAKFKRDLHREDIRARGEAMKETERQKQKYEHELDERRHKTYTKGGYNLKTGELMEPIEWEAYCKEWPNQCSPGAACPLWYNCGPKVKREGDVEGDAGVGKRMTGTGMVEKREPEKTYNKWGWNLITDKPMDSPGDWPAFCMEWQNMCFDGCPKFVDCFFDKREVHERDTNADQTGKVQKREPEKTFTKWGWNLRTDKPMDSPGDWPAFCMEWQNMCFEGCPRFLDCVVDKREVHEYDVGADQSERLQKRKPENTYTKGGYNLKTGQVMRAYEWDAFCAEWPTKCHKGCPLNYNCEDTIMV